MSTKATWVRVKAADELRPGLTVEIRPCGFCGRTERVLLTSQGQTDMPASLHGSGDVLESSGTAWRTAPGLCLNPRRMFDPSAAIATGRLWRLADETLQEATTTRARELVKGDASS